MIVRRRHLRRDTSTIDAYSLRSGTWCTLQAPATAETTLALCVTIALINATTCTSTDSQTQGAQKSRKVTLVRSEHFIISDMFGDMCAESVIWRWRRIPTRLLRDCHSDAAKTRIFEHRSVGIEEQDLADVFILLKMALVCIFCVLETSNVCDQSESVLSTCADRARSLLRRGGDNPTVLGVCSRSKDMNFNQKARRALDVVSLIGLPRANHTDHQSKLKI